MKFRSVKKEEKIHENLGNLQRKQCRKLTNLLSVQRDEMKNCTEGSLYFSKRGCDSGLLRHWEKDSNSLEPEFVNLLRAPGIYSQPGDIDSWAPRKFTNSGSGCVLICLLQQVRQVNNGLTGMRAGTSRIRRQRHTMQARRDGTIRNRTMCTWRH